MKKFLSCTKTATVLLVVTLILLGAYTYLLVRPISYGMPYRNETVYDGGTFEGVMQFQSDDTLIIRNTNFDDELQSRYYYKDGYVFFTMAETDTAYQAEIAYIDNNFEEAVNVPFYAGKINAFRQISSEADGYTTVYTCTPAIILAIAGGVVALALVALTVTSWILSLKSKSKE